MSHDRRRYHYIRFYKPFGVLSQFTPEHGHLTLKDFGPFPQDVYPVGRLDLESEGLILLTNDNAVKHRASDPKFEHPRTYCVQVERIPDAAALETLRSGVIVGGRRTKTAEARLLEEPHFPPRSVPIRFRKTVPTAWIEIILREGRYHQVRKMTAAVGHPTLRLIRTAIGNLGLCDLQPGESRALSNSEIALLRSSLGIRPR
ncbi:MAG: pseudouridine synthase [Ignavibacteriae bacterium]|nr:pseudouridine synthase [Ignavibacteriota bacterium]